MKPGCRKDKLMKNTIAIHWRRVTAWLLMLSGLWNIGQAARINHLGVSRMETAALLIQAEQARDRALDNLEIMTVRAEQEQRTAVIPAAVHEVADTYQYIGECTITSYCPCEVCCGQWADGLTATGIPAEPGIVAVDPEVIPLGSVVIIDGQKYLAADTGVKGLHVDVCAAGHQEAEDFGVQTMAVWVETEEGTYG